MKIINVFILGNQLRRQNLIKNTMHTKYKINEKKKDWGNIA